MTKFETNIQVPFCGTMRLIYNTLSKEKDSDKSGSLLKQIRHLTVSKWRKERESGEGKPEFKNVFSYRACGSPSVDNPQRPNTREEGLLNQSNP